jgi:hypothetical protein
VEPYADSLCSDYTMNLVDEDDINSELSYVQHDISRMIVPATQRVMPTAAKAKKARISQNADSAGELSGFIITSL